MMKLKRILSVLLIVFLIFAGCFIILEKTQKNIFAMTIRETEIKTQISDDHFHMLDAGESWEYTGKTASDSSGDLWCQIRYFNNYAWIKAKDCVIGDAMTCLQRHPDCYDGFFFEIVYEGTTDEDEQSGKWLYLAGFNEELNLVKWIIQSYHAWSDNAPQLVSCSWTEQSDLVQGNQYNSEFIWNRIMEGETVSTSEREIRSKLLDFGRTAGGQATRVYLPDDPSIAGPQEIVYQTDDYLLTFRFDLVYEGGYAGSGEGWSLSNVEYTRSRRSD